MYSTVEYKIKSSYPMKCKMSKESAKILLEAQQIDVEEELRKASQLHTTANVRFGWKTILTQIAKATSHIRKRCMTLPPERILQ